MSITYSVTLNEAQDKAFRHIALDPQEWLTNVTMNRVNAAIEQIARAEVDRKLAAGEPISGTKEDLVLASDIKSVVQMNADELAARQAENAARQEAQTPA